MDSRDVSNPHNIGIYERGEPQSGESEKGKNGADDTVYKK
jgi:hypothetical protein